MFVVTGFSRSGPAEAGHYEHRAELPAVECVEPMEFLGGRRQLRPIQFKRYRRKQGDDGGRRPSGTFRITFASPVQGPLCLGHSCHFGLGLFLPEVVH